ncbi:DUF739 family protein [Dehalobacter sp. 4CP]|uniref:DUF739 family protein n=1 Tax=Dehalobacter sp. CP TaxID=2594474 RepID=UPI0039ECF6F6
MFIIFNHEKLEERINAMFDNIEAFGKFMGMSKQRINSRLKSATEFTQSEIEKAAELLNIQPEEIQTYFFDVEVCRS